MYQLKITLNSIIPPIWRRLLISENIIFYKLPPAPGSAPTVEILNRGIKTILI
jgi:hypothetical protein